MYHGPAEQMVELSLLGRDELGPGEQGLAQLFAAVPVVALDGDRFILRVPSPAATVAGGVILDIVPRRHRRRDKAVLDSLVAREHADQGTMALIELGKHPFGLSEDELASRLGLSGPRLAQVLAPLRASDHLRRVGASWMTQEQWQVLKGRLTNALSAYHRAQPLRPGMPKEELRSKTAIPAEVFNAAIALLIAEATLIERGGDIAESGHRPELTGEQEAAAGAFLAELELQPFNPPPLVDLVRRHHLSAAVLQYLVAQQRIVRVNEDTVFARSAYDAAVNRLRTHLTEHRTLTVAAARDVLGSSRRYVLPLLEWLDAQKITRRVGDDRILRD